jgi:geranylgeranyl diphosphate synthase type II
MEAISHLHLHPRLREVYAYSLFAPGKRFRPQLTFLSSAYLRIPYEQVFPLAGAVEMIHTYSLIHDDLPAMDNASTRRGQPAVHLKYGDALAILTGDGLLTDAFLILASGSFPPEHLSEALRYLAHCAGGEGMVSGQVGDLYDLLPRENPDEETLRRVHAQKTGALIQASVLLPFLAFAPDHPHRAFFEEYAGLLGVFYQIGDDLLDPRESTGKDPGKDSEKVTYRSFYPPSYLRERTLREWEAMKERLEPLDPGFRSAMLDLLRWTLERER